MGLGPVSKEMDEREGESRGLEGEQGDPERETIPPPHSKGLNPDKGLWLSPKARWSCVGWQRHVAFCQWRPHACPRGCSPLLKGRLVQWDGKAELWYTWALRAPGPAEAWAFLMRSWESRAGSQSPSLSCCSLLIQGICHISLVASRRRGASWGDWIWIRGGEERK